MSAILAERCHVANGECEGATLLECFRCGLPVCRECSDVIPYLRYRHKRICDDCQEELRK